MFEKINKTCKYVIDNSQYVKINYNKIKDIIEDKALAGK